MDSRLWFSLNGASRYCMAHMLSEVLPLYIVNEYPKSGGSWVTEMLSDALCVPFPRNRLPMLRSSILHGHMMHKWNMHNRVIVWRDGRDGRDVLISEYFHSVFENEKGNSRRVRATRKNIQFEDVDDISSNLVDFMNYRYIGAGSKKPSWNQFVNRWHNCSGSIHVLYEELRSDPVNSLSRVIEELTGSRPSADHISTVVENHSFENKTSRTPGEEIRNSFLRKGIVGDWKNYFNREAKERFCELAGRSLVVMGYESDNSWLSA